MCLAMMALPAWAAHAYSQFGDIKYSAGFDHFEYVNPLAPKGGSLTLVPNTRQSNFDKYNPFTLRGEHPPGLMNEGQESSLVFETLLTGNLDEATTAYGLLADDVTVAPDKLSAVFRINPLARFNNGDPVLALDVKFSYDMQTSPQASPRIRVLFEGIKAVTVLGDRLVRFDFSKADDQMPLVAGSIMIFSHTWGGGKAFDKIITDLPIGSGPYRVGPVDFGKTITYQRRLDYWARDLNVRRGSYNFDSITYKIYTDDTVRLEAFKAGEFDVIEENIARRWARQYKGMAFDNGSLTRSEFANPNPGFYQGYVFNTRRPLLQDVRVRQAIAMAMDFDWLNRQLFYNSYKRIEGFFPTAEFTASGLPKADELALLEPWRSRLPPQVFGPAARLPSTEPPRSLRQNLREARALLQAAGWSDSDGVLRNAKGQALEIEMLFDQPSLIRIIGPFQKNLEKLGIRMKFRIVDYALLKKRLDVFDFDMTSVAFSSSSTPGTDLRDVYSSASAGRTGNLNYWGITDPVVDALVENIIAAKTRAQLATGVRALDRVLGHGYYAVPNWYAPTYRVAYKGNAFERPAKMPDFYSAQSWISSVWWVRSALPGSH